MQKLKSPYSTLGALFNFTVYIVCWLCYNDNMSIENDPNNMPEVRILKCPPPFEGVARAIAGIYRLGRTTEECLTEHNSGAAAMLDANLRAEASDY